MVNNHRNGFRDQPYSVEYNLPWVQAAHDNRADERNVMEQMKMYLNIEIRS